MKKATLLPIMVLSILISGLQSPAQVAIDPVAKAYRIGGSSELYIAYSNSDNSFTRKGALLVDRNLDDMTLPEDISQCKHMDIMLTAAASGDFNGDGVDEVVWVRDQTNGGRMIVIQPFDDELCSRECTSYTLDELNTMNYTRLRIITGNFDVDRADEFAICYGGPGETVRLHIFDPGEDMEIQLLASYNGIQYVDHLFDIAAGDVDGDGMDEIAMVQSLEKPWEKDGGVHPPVITSKYDVDVYKYDTLEQELYHFSQNTSAFEIDNASMSDNNFYLRDHVKVSEMRIACGDLDADQRDELVVGWTFFQADRHWDCGFLWLEDCYDWRNNLYLNSFDIVKDSWMIQFEESHYLGNTGTGETGLPPSLCSALSLKCEKLDNLGRDEVLINGFSSLYILGSTGTGMELEIKEEITPTGAYINIGGSEAFAVADLDPDTENLDFNKEIILLLSDRNAWDQTKKVADIPSFEIYQPGEINASAVQYLEPGPAHDLPPEEVNIEVSALVTGDYDAKGASIYHIGTPEIVQVRELPFPLVILNAPPVHFDVLQGVTHDLCDAFFPGTEPSFSALYNTRIDDKMTTSVAVENSYGFSSDLRVYAMAGGSGFETSFQQDFEAGQSYYRSQSHTSSIEEEKEVFNEDFVLFSCLDYNYYKYPVYDRDLVKVGAIAMLNPDSENLKSIWGSANGWDHPGYSFDHEPGNILSYRSYLNDADMCTRSSDFSFWTFTQVPVSNTGSGSFKFSYENLSCDQATYSFSAGVGANQFIKAGIEASISIETAPLGIGGSVETEVRAGVSRELSTQFSTSRLSNHSTELSDAFQIDGNIGRLNKSYDDVARYNITPYIYRSQSGALVLDYLVDLDENYMDWWVENYGQKPDLAFILPWRYAVEKGSENIKPSKLQQTNEIQFHPPNAAPGDTICITTRVHNYSLMAFDDMLRLNYYLGDPANGGVELTDIYGQKGTEEQVTMIRGAIEDNMDFVEYFNFFWLVPDSISCSPRIYAVIDEENAFSEIHENNNTGWNKLPMQGCTDCSYTENYIGTKNMKPAFSGLRIYPNPASDYSYLRFSLESDEDVRIELFDLAGRYMGTIADQRFPAGKQEVEFRTGNLADGIYICRVISATGTGIARLQVHK